MNIIHNILVVTDSKPDAELVETQLQQEYSDDEIKITLSTNFDHSVEDFESCQPAVIILAFHSIEKSEHYYQELFRLSDLAHTQPHQTLVLATPQDAPEAFNLCRNAYFDSYIVFWSVSNDPLLLAMALHNALRHIEKSETDMPAPTVDTYSEQVQELASLEIALNNYARKGDQQIDVTDQSLALAQQEINSALDSFSHSLGNGSPSDSSWLQDQGKLQQMIDELKTEAVADALQPVAKALQSMRQWAESLTEGLAPQVKSANTLAGLVKSSTSIVLVVDDDEFQHQIIMHVLDAPNYKLVFAYSGVQALKTLERVRPDLILMDLNMPKQNGIEVTRLVKANPANADIPLIMTTGNSEKSVVLECLKAGACDFVIKPLNKEVMLAKVNKYLKKG